MEILLYKISKIINDSELYEYLRVIFNWKLDNEENILKILCELGHEVLATKFLD